MDFRNIGNWCFFEFEENCFKFFIVLDSLNKNEKGSECLYDVPYHLSEVIVRICLFYNFNFIIWYKISMQILFDHDIIYFLEFIANALDMFAQNLREIWIFETYHFFK